MNLAWKNFVRSSGNLSPVSITSAKTGAWFRSSCLPRCLALGLYGGALRRRQFHSSFHFPATVSIPNGQLHDDQNMPLRRYSSLVSESKVKMAASNAPIAPFRAPSDRVRGNYACRSRPLHESAWRARSHAHGSDTVSYPFNTRVNVEVSLSYMYYYCIHRSC
jgi:hypothetical protein